MGLILNFRQKTEEANGGNIHRSPTENYAVWLTFDFVTRLRYADKRIVNIMKVYIERNNLQLELIRYRTV